MRTEQFLLVPLIVLFLSAAPSVDSLAAPRPGDLTIDTSLLHSMVVENTHRLEAGRKMKFLIVDVRTVEEYNESHVLGAISIPEKDFDKMQKLLPEDKNTLMVVYCTAQCVRSRRWATKAAAAGYSNVVIYSDGFPHWKEQHMPVAF